MEGFEDSFMSLCKVLVSTGLLVARACEAIAKGGEMANVKTVEQLLADSHSSKARLLHYVSLTQAFPVA